MNVVDLFNRVGRHARTGDFTKLSRNEQDDIAQAINSAIQKMYYLLPSYYKEMTEGLSLAGPQPVTLSVTQFSNQLATAVFTDAQIGCSVVLQGDPGWNTVLAPDALQNPYMGQTGTTSGTVYGDAWHSTRYPFDRVIGDPQFSNRGDGLFFNQSIPNINSWGQTKPYAQSVGQPQGWFTQMLGQSQGNEPLMVIRFLPAPDQAYSMFVRTSYCPKRLLRADYNSAAVIVVPDQFIEPVLIPLCYKELMGTPAWESRKDEQFILQRAAEAEIYAKNQIGQNASPLNRIFTPVGY